MLLSRIIATGDLVSAHKFGITADDFVTSEGRSLFRLINSYYESPTTRGSTLGPNAMHSLFPTFYLVDDPGMTYDALCAEVRKGRVRSSLKALIKTADDTLDMDPHQAASLLAEGTETLRRLSATKQTDVFALDALNRLMLQYNMRKDGIDTSIARWAWEPLQLATGGIQADDYIIFYGRPKSMKSWVVTALIADLILQGKSLLIYTKEMTADNFYQRIWCTVAGVDYGRFRGSNLDNEEEAKLVNTMHLFHYIQQNQRIVVLSGKDVGGEGDTVSWFRTKVAEYSPNVAIIDGLYLMADARGGSKQKEHERVKHISRDIRQMILDTGVPVIGTIQANREAAKNKEANTEEIAFSDAIGQDATCSIRVIREKETKTLALLLAGSREFALEGFKIYGRPAIDFSYAGPLTASDAIEAQRNDNDSSTKRRAAKVAANRVPSVVDQQAQPPAPAPPQTIPYQPAMPNIVASVIPGPNGVVNMIEK